MEFPAGKRQKHFDIGVGDRISHLPDSILCHILSFLPTRSSVQTCLLSKRWRSVWTSVPVLDLSDEPFQYLRDRRRTASAWTSSFRNFLNKVLSLRSHLSVQILRIRVFNSGAVSPVLSHILDAISPTVEEIDLFVVDGRLHFPQIVLSCGQLSVLKLHCSHIELDFPESVPMPNLKVFHVRYASSSNPCAASMTRLLCGSPILEELAFYSKGRVTESHNFSIVSSSLSNGLKQNGSLNCPNFFYREVTDNYCNFTFGSIGNDTDGGYSYINDDINTVVVINAPNLEFLVIKATGFKIDLKNTPSILKASIITSEYCYCLGIQEIPSNLRTIFNAKVLCLPMNMIKDPSVYELIHCTNLKKLELRYCEQDGLSILPQFLKRLPCLEHLVLHKYDCAYTPNTWEGLELEKSEIHCLNYSLKTLQLENFRCYQQEMDVLEYFVQNSSVLNEIRLSRYSACVKWQEMLFLNKLLIFPRCSNSFRIIFCA